MIRGAGPAIKARAVFVWDLDAVVRITTGESGDAAL
jgi:nitrogen regulatory protein PII